MREIILEGKLADKLDPLDPKTLRIEAKLGELALTPDGKIQGVIPLRKGANGAFPKNSGHKRIEKYHFIISPGVNDAIRVFDGE